MVELLVMSRSTLMWAAKSGSVIECALLIRCN